MPAAPDLVLAPQLSLNPRDSRSREEGQRKCPAEVAGNCGKRGAKPARARRSALTDSNAENDSWRLRVGRGFAMASCRGRPFAHALNLRDRAAEPLEGDV